MTMVLFFVILLALVGFIVAAGRFGADSRPLDERFARHDWPGVRHGG